MKRNSLHLTLLIVFSVLILTNASGQKILFGVTKFLLDTVIWRVNFDTTTGRGIMMLDIDSCQNKRICYRLRNPPPSPEVSDITITPKGEVYGNCAGLGTYLQYVGNFDGSGFGKDSCHYEIESLYHPGVDFFDMNLAIQSNEAGQILCLDYNAWKYYPTTKKWEFLGVLPDFYNSDGNIPYNKYITAKDGTLTKRDGEYYYITEGRGFSKHSSGRNAVQQKLVYLDTLNAQNSKVIHTFDDTLRIIHGMYTIRQSCDEYNTYVAYFKYNDSINNLPDSLRYSPDYWAIGELDFETGEINNICEKGVISSYMYLWSNNLYDFGVAVPWTILDSDCIVTVDLDLDNSSGAEGKYDYRDTLRCIYDSIYLSDIDPEVFAKTYIDSLQVFFAGATPDGASEYLEVSNPGGLGIYWKNPKYVTLINNTNDDFLPLEVAVRSIKYRNTSVVPTMGERKIAFVAFSGKRQSDTAYAYLQLIEDRPYAGRDTMLNLCINEGPVFLDSLLTDSADKNGQWIGSTVQPGVFDPVIDDTGVYQYIVEKDGCKTDTAVVEIIVNQLPKFDLGQDTLICEGDMLVLNCDIDGADYLWQDGSTQQSYTVQDSGIYILIVTDDEGCEYTDSIKVGIRPGQNTVVKKDTSLCHAQSIEWNGIHIDTAGEYSFSTANMYGCDSTTILKVWNYPEVYVSIMGDSIFCQGDKLTLFNNFYPHKLWSTGDTTSQIEISKGGWYYLEVTNEQGCTGKDSLYVEQIEAIQVDVETKSETCYNENDGELVIQYIGGGKGDIDYYLDGEQISENIITDLSPGVYSLEAIDSTVCKWTKEIRIDSAPQLWVNIGNDINTTVGTQLQIEINHNIENIDTIQWYINEKLSPKTDSFLLISPTQNTKIEVVITTANGCELTDELQIKLKEEEEQDVYIPNIFTPNGDGINDNWKIQGNNQIQEIEKIAIYNRWGNKVFYKEHVLFNPSSTTLWDGNYKNRLINSGVFVYTIELKLHSGETIIKSGDITVIR